MRRRNAKQIHAIVQWAWCKSLDDRPGGRVLMQQVTHWRDWHPMNSNASAMNRAFLRSGAANPISGANCRPACSLGTELEFGRTVYAVTCVPGGPRLPGTTGSARFPKRRTLYFLHGHYL